MGRLTEQVFNESSKHKLRYRSYSDEKHRKDVEIHRRRYKMLSPEEKRELTRIKREQRRTKMQGIILEYKAQPCADCKNSFPHYIMEFDHSRGEKLFNVNPARASRYGWDYIKQELDKCDVVCANCHRRRTFERGQQRGTPN